MHKECGFEKRFSCNKFNLTTYKISRGTAGKALVPSDTRGNDTDIFTTPHCFSSVKDTR